MPPETDAIFRRWHAKERERGSKIMRLGDWNDRLAHYDGPDDGLHWDGKTYGNHDPMDGQPYLSGPGWRAEHGDRLDPLWSRKWFLRPFAWAVCSVAYAIDRDRARQVGAWRAFRDRGFEERWLRWQVRHSVPLMVVGHSHLAGIWRRMESAKPLLITTPDVPLHVGPECSPVLAVCGSWLGTPPYKVVVLEGTPPDWTVKIEEVS